MKKRAQKKVCILTRAWFPNHQVLFEALSLELASSNVELHYLLLSEREANRPWEDFEGVKKLTPQTIPSFKLHIFDKEMFFSKKVRSHLEQIDPDLLILSPWSELPLHDAKRWALQKGIPCIGWLMGPRQSAKGRFGIFRQQFSHRIIRNFVSGMDELFCYGKGVMEAINDITDFPISEMTCVKHVVDEKVYQIHTIEEREELKTKFRARWNIDQQKFVVGYLGQYIARKGPQTLLHACNELKDTSNDFHILMLGRGPQLNSLNELATKRSQNLTLLDWLPAAELKGFFASVDCMVVPSEFDDWGTVVNECCHARTPLICSRGAYAHFDLIEDGETGLLFDAGDVVGLAEKLKFAMLRPEKMRAMALASHRLIAKWKVRDASMLWHQRICSYLV